MKSVLAVLLLSVYCAFAQHVTCTPDVPAATCKRVGELFSAAELTPDVVIADPVSFGTEEKGLEKKMIATLRNPTMANRYSEDVLIERDGDTCPKRFVISTHAFRPVSIKKDSPHATIEYGDGVDVSTVVLVSTYLWGYDEGCRFGLAMSFSDMTKKP
jgi:hypothetical protein